MTAADLESAKRFAQEAVQHSKDGMGVQMAIYQLLKTLVQHEADKAAEKSTG